MIILIIILGSGIHREKYIMSSLLFGPFHEIFYVDKFWSYTKGGENQWPGGAYV